VLQVSEQQEVQHQHRYVRNMAKHKYSFPENENHARAVGRDLGISTKISVEICGFLRGKPLGRAKKELKQVIEKKLAVPYKRYNKDTPHRTKLGPGRFPGKASSAILNVLEGVTSNAQSKGLSTGKLGILHICAHKAHSPMKGGRNRGRQMKRTHIEVVVAETKIVKKDKKSKAVNSKKVQVKKETKKEEKKEEPKAEVKKEVKEQSPEQSREEVKKEPKEAQSKEAEPKND
jgi:large subunit ribosomal protein L22